MSVKRSSSESIGVRLEPYKHMKDSGVEWLGAVPAHWEAVRLKSLMTNVVEQASTATQGRLFIASENVESWTGKLDDLEPRFGAPDQHKSFRTGDVLFGKLRPYLAKVTRAQTGGCCVGEFLVLRSRSSECFDGAYAEQLLRSKLVIDAINSSTYGARMPRAEWSFIGGMRVVCPPLPEQTAIARFLGHATGRMERYIRAKEKLIALLEEQKQVIVHDAITGRFDVRTGQPYPAYEDSGLKWLGAVPVHWEIRRTKTLFGLRTEKSGSAHGLELLSIYTHIGVRPRKDLKEKGNKASTTDDYWIVNRGDLIANKLLAWMGAIGVSHYYGVTSPAYDILMPIVDLESDYYHLLFRSPTYLQQFKQYSRGIMDMRLRLYFDQFGQIPVPFPRIEEQKAIVDFCDKSTTGVKAKIDRVTREIELLREFRTCLISDVVTGKLDVREAAAKLPELDPVTGGEGAESSQPELKSRLPNAPLRAQSIT